ncbi:BatD family protein [Neptunomonas antarctica]|uniref:Oxygen tolerance n=1 Tax=Neptunomonas antarctica TaxID=619304 RepID=A0A1N7MMX1_9GAMM|nr:BatD family protein [Neptunomonas antarctica]SIS87239.1 Oxygen tolerance [Neptunomonas antarctica]
MVRSSRAWLMVFLLCSSLNVQAVIKSQINHSMIEQGETIRLSINIADVNADQINLQPLEQDFSVLGRSQQSSTVIRNGKIESSTILVLTLLPKRTGDLQIPAINIDGDQTQSHSLRVTEVTQATAVEGGIEMLSTLSSQQPKVQQPLIYKTNLLVGRQIFNATLQGPTIKTGKALIEALGEQKQSQQTLKGREITVVEQTWLITPQQSGPLEITPAQVVGQIETGRRIQVLAQGYQLDVEPIPKNFSGTVWLPAESLMLNDVWSDDQFAVGEPITRTITLKAQGISSYQLSAITLPEVDGLKQYAATPDVSQDYQSDKLTSTMTQEVTLIPSAAGAVVLPEISIPWWDVQSNSEKTAVIAARTLLVGPAKVVASSTLSVSPPSSQLPVQSTPSPSPATTAEAIQATLLSQSAASVQLPVASAINAWWIAIISAVAGSVVTLLVVMLLIKRRSRQPNSGADNVGEGAGNTSPARLSASALAIKKACASNDSAAARRALIAWGQQLWPPCSNLNQLAGHVSPELQQAIAVLHRQSYSQTPESWCGEPLWQAIQGYKVQQKATAKPHTEKLEPLYLSS